MVASHLMLLFALVAGVLGVVYSLFTAAWIMRQNSGTDRMKQISDFVREGATAFLNREYRTVGMVAVVVIILLLLLGFFTTPPAEAGHIWAWWAIALRFFRRYFVGESFRILLPTRLQLTTN